MADERELIARLKLVYDQQSADQAKGGLDKAKKSTDDVAKNSKSASTAIKVMGEAMKIVGVAGAAALGAAGLMINKYQAAAGIGESTSIKWAVANRGIEMSFVKLGRTIEQQALPYLQKAATLAEAGADYAEKNPQVVNGALQLAAGLSVVGVLSKTGALAKLAPFALKAIKGIGAGTAAIGESIASDFAIGSALAKIGGTNALAGGLAHIGTGIAPAVGYSAVALAGVALGQFAADFIAKSPLNDQIKKASNGQVGFTTAAQNATVAAYGAGKLFGGEQGGLAAAQWMGKLTGAIQETGGAAKDTSDDLGKLPDKMRVYIAYQRQETQAKEEYGIQVSRQTRDFARQQLVAEADFGIQRTRQLRDFQYGLMTSEQDYYRQRQISARDFGIEMSRTEADHQKEVRRSQEDHDWRMKRIIMEGDGMAFWEENRSYNLQRARGEEDYTLQQSRRNEDFGRSMADQEAQYQISRERQLVEYQRQQADQAADFDRQRQLATQQFAITRSDQQQDFDRQRSLRLQAFDDQLRDLGGFWTNMADTQQFFTTQMVTDYQSMLNGALTGNDMMTRPGDIHRASGGLMLPGMTYVVGENSGAPETIRMGAGGSARVYPNGSMHYPSAGGGRGGGFTYQDNRTFSRGLAAEERAQIRAETEQILFEVVNGSAL